MSFLTQPITISSLLNGRKRSIADINGYVTTKEDTTDTLVITKQPVQTGSPITDHSYMEPTVFSTSILFADNVDSVQTLDQIYGDLLELQAAREPIEVQTPKRTYKNMLIEKLSQTTDKTTENCLSIFFTFQQVIFADIGIATVPPLQQKNPGATQPVQDTGNKSVFKRIYNGVTGK